MLKAHSSPGLTVPGVTETEEFDEVYDDDEEPNQGVVSFGEGVEVKVVVGTSVFLTHMSTLCSRDPDSLLAKLAREKFASRAPLCLKFNRDPAWFSLIMTYLRTGSIDFRRLSTPQIQTFLSEAQYYALQGLYDKIIAERERRLSPSLSRKDGLTVPTNDEHQHTASEYKDNNQSNDELIFELII